jgi:hypothetical protein
MYLPRGEEFDAFDVCSYDTIGVAKHLIESFCERYDVTAEAAFREFRFLVKTAQETGKVKRGRGDRLYLSWRSFMIIISPDAKMVLGYHTRHLHRTPIEVFHNLQPGQAR